MKRAFQSRGKRGLRLASRALVALTLARSAGTTKCQGGYFQRKRAFKSRGKRGLWLASWALIALALALDRGAGTAKRQKGISKDKGI